MKSSELQPSFVISLFKIILKRPIYSILCTNFEKTNVKRSKILFKLNDKNKMFRFAVRELLDMFTMGQSLASAAGHFSG